LSRWFFGLNSLFALTESVGSFSLFEKEIPPQTRANHGECRNC